MPKVQIREDAKTRETIPTNRANPPTNGKPIGMPKPLQKFVSMLRITRL